MSSKGINGAALVAVSAGAMLAYSGLKGKKVSNTFRSFITGGDPASVPQDAPVNVPVSGILNDLPSQSDAATPGLLARASANRATVIAAAQSQIGKPYVWATPVSASNPDPKSFDCSGLTMWCYAKIGVKLAHYTGTQYTQLQHVPFSSAQPGDLVFFKNTTIHHVGIYIGNGQMIDAPTEGVPVGIHSVHWDSNELMSTVGVIPGG